MINTINGAIKCLITSRVTTDHCAYCFLFYAGENAGKVSHNIPSFGRLDSLFSPPIFNFFNAVKWEKFSRPPPEHTVRISPLYAKRYYDNCQIIVSPCSDLAFIGSRTTDCEQKFNFGLCC